MGVSEKKIRRLLKKSVLKNHRSLIVILGLLGSQKLHIIHRFLTKVNKRELDSLWCSKDGDSYHRNETEEHSDSTSDASENNIFKPCCIPYRNLNKVLHQSFDVAILQDIDVSSLLQFNLILPNIKGGGALIFLFPECITLEDFKKMNMNETGQASRFSKRFLQSLNASSNCLVLDDKLQILCSPKFSEKPCEAIVPFYEKIANIKSKCGDDVVMTSLLDLCLTEDQAKLLFKFLDILKKRTFHSIVSVLSAFGRGKSAALGLAIAGSLAFNFSNIFISSSCHSNVDVLFRFLLKGLDVLQYKEDKDYDLIESANPKFKNALIGLNVFKNYPQSIRFIFPDDVGHKLEQAELVIIDEAASIPSHKLKNLIGPYIVFMSSTTSGAVSTSAYLYDSMRENLQHSTRISKENSSTFQSSSLSFGNSFENIMLKEPIHYASDDVVESWNYHVFCLESSISSQLSFGCPETKQCQLYKINRDALLSGSSFSDRFLNSLISMFNQSNYILDPKDFISLADSPDYQVFVLLPPLSKMSNKPIPEVLCAVLVHLETKFPSDIVQNGSNLNDPIAKCFNQWDKVKDTSMQGIHIINLATHPCYKRMGYGLRSLQLLQEFYEGKWISLEEKTKDFETRQQILQQDNSFTNSPLLIPLSELKHEKIEFICVSFILSSDIFSFWKKAGFVPVFLKTKEKSDSITCFMLKSIAEEFESYVENNWLKFCNYYFTLLNSYCQDYPALYALSIINSYKNSSNVNELSKDQIDLFLKPYCMKSLEKYCLRLQDLNSIIHIIPIISKMYFKNLLKNVNLPVIQEAILLSYGLQNKTIDEISKDLDLQAIQVIGLLNRTLKKITNYITSIIEKGVESTLITTDVEMKPLTQDLNTELEEAANEIHKQQDKLQDLDVSQYAIKGSEDEWQKALFSGRKTLVSIKSIKKNVENHNKSFMKNEIRTKFKKSMKKRKK